MMPTRITMLVASLVLGTAADARASIDDLVAALAMLHEMDATARPTRPPTSRPRERGRTLSLVALPAAGTIPYFREIEAAAHHSGVPLPDLLSLVAAESNFDSRAVSRAGAVGLMQVLPRVHAKINGVSPNDLFIPSVNLRIGSLYLAELLERYRDKGPRQLEFALAAYNAGPSVADRGYLRWPRETRAYIKSFKRNQRRFRRLFATGGAT